MIDQLKSLAFDKLKDAMAPNSLGEGETTAAAEQGSAALVNSLMENISAGDLGSITSLFSNEGNTSEDNDVFKLIVGKLAGILQGQGMDASSAQSEANNIAPDLINSLKEKFMSNDDADSSFDLGSIGSLLGGGEAGDLLGKAKSLF
ncbi:hypothetical protein ZORO111903_20450 [Zobellia roscoffensis]|uniref:hypothetical protein n=1 Tax=Zobellia roscoffensis TaxID=2779508 RepID=UPI00188D21E4|nr:hypothetical protein [Zobellia roscoffensis]